MRSLVVMNRINVIIRPATSGFNFSCLQAPQFDQMAIAGKEGKDKDWDRNRYRYRRYQAYFAFERFRTVCIRVFQDADGFLFYIELWGVSSVGRASDLHQVTICVANRWSERSEDAFCEAEPRLAQQGLHIA